MHNVPVTRTTARTRLLTALTSCVVVAVLAGCSGDSDTPAPAPRPSPSATPGSASATETPYLAVPEGVELTAQGSTLRVGDQAVVAYEPRQDVVGVLAVTVDRIEQTTFRESFAGWKLSEQTRRSTPYFVRAELTNEGAVDLGGRPVPLYVADSSGKLLEPSTFKGTFEPCPSRPFPESFGSGDTVTSCLVYLAPEGSELSAVSFRPTEEFVPITWTGPILEPRPDKATEPGSPGKPGKGGKNDQNDEGGAGAGTS